MDKLISIIIPVYNVENYLKDCIESILKQSYTNFEMWLIDDGSTDNSSYICEEYAKQDERIKVIHKTNGGLSSARNIGLDNAQGEYVAFIDSDDSINNEFLKELYNLCENENCDIAQCDFLYTAENSIKLKEQNTALIKFMTGEEAVMKCCDPLIGVKFNVAWNKLYKRKLFCGVRYPDGKIHEDEFTTYKLFNRANRVAVIDKYLYWYLQRNDSIMGRKFDERRLVRLEAYKERLNFLKEKKLDDIYYKFLVLYYRSIWEYHNDVKKYIPNNEELLLKIEIEAKKVSKEILTIPDKSFFENLKVVYQHLSDMEKETYRKQYGNALYINSKEEFIFPYSLIPFGARIALYGGGNVGRAYFQQIVTMKYADITIWVDNKWKSISKNGFTIEPLDALFREEKTYDYVVLAIRNADMAMSVKRDLISWGMNPNKIIWHNPVMLSEADAMYIHREHKKMKDLTDCLGKDRIILMNTPNHGNLGDHALAIAAEQFLKTNFSSYEILEFTGKQWDFCKEEILKIIKPNDVIFFVGGGYMGDVWLRESTRIKDIISNCPCNTKVFLPQTFYYENTITNEEKQFFIKAEKTLYIHRENISKDSFTKNVVDQDSCNQMYPDMVLGLESQISKDRKGVSLCFRIDKECLISNDVKKHIQQKLEDMGVDYDMVDTVVPWNIEPEFRKEEVNKFLNKIAGRKLFITDRLHGMLFALITHTPCIAFDNKTHKIKGVYESIKHIPYVKCVSEEDFDVNLIEQYIDCATTTFNFDDVFKDMAKQIKKWIKNNLSETEDII